MPRPRSMARSDAQATAQAKAKAQSKSMHEHGGASGRRDTHVSEQELEHGAPQAVPPGLTYAFRFGTARGGAQGVLDVSQAQGLLHGIAAILSESPYAPSETSVAEFLTRVVETPSEVAVVQASAHARTARLGLFLLLEGGRPIAFAQVRLVFEDAEVDYVAVHPDARNRGLGSWLLREIEREALQQGAGRLLLEVGERNIPARQLYRSSGFEPMGRRENYYHGKEAALVLEKPL